MVKTSWGNVRIIKSNFWCDSKRSGDVLPYCRPNKKPERTHPYPKHTIRIAPLKREKATIVGLRNKGYPMNMISKFLGRSTSFVHRVTEANKWFNRKIDMRKLPAKIRMRCSSIRWRNFQKYWPLWEQFILGEVDKPP